jgi:hypothetical protein
MAREIVRFQRKLLQPTLGNDSRPLVRTADRVAHRESGMNRVAMTYRLCSPPRVWTVSNDASERHSSPRDPARNTASVRVLTASLEKMRFTCDFTVSGEMSKLRAMRLLVKP